jgi:type IV pilus assembly protein PilN
VIRVNLLPDARRAQTSSSEQTWLWWVCGLVAVEIVGLLVLYSFKQEELDGWNRKNQTIEAQIKLSKEKVKDQVDVKNKLERLRAREDAIAKLQSARTGPTAMLLEVARLMTKGRGPSVASEALAKVQNENPLAMFNPNWDARRLWITEFVEQARTVKLRGRAIDGEDVSELARRMNLSAYFYDVKLLPATRSVDKEASGLDTVSFQLEARVRY